MNVVIPSDPYSFGYSEIGTILTAHGIHGEVKLHATTDTSLFEEFASKMKKDPNVILNLYIKKPNRRTPRKVVVKTIRKQNNDIFLLQFKNIDIKD